MVSGEVFGKAFETIAIESLYGMRIRAVVRGGSKLGCVEMFVGEEVGGGEDVEFDAWVEIAVRLSWYVVVGNLVTIG